MSKILPILTPISFKESNRSLTFDEKVLQAASKWLNWRGRQAFVLPSQKSSSKNQLVKIEEQKPKLAHLVLHAARITLCFLITVPALCIKVAFHNKKNYLIQKTVPAKHAKKTVKLDQKIQTASAKQTKKTVKTNRKTQSAAGKSGVGSGKAVQLTSQEKKMGFGFAPSKRKFESQSQYAKALAEDFIAHFGKKEMHNPLRENKELVLNSEEKNYMKKFLKDNFDFFENSYNKPLPKGMLKIGQGHHCTIYQFEKFPRYVFKLGDLATFEKETEANKRGLEIIQSKQLDLINLPASTTVDFEENGKKRAFFVQEKGPLKLSWKGQDEFWFRINQEYETTKNAVFKNNIDRIVEQCTLFCLELGYWDVQGGNFPLVSEDIRTVFGIDFENIEKTNNSTEGVTRLAKLFHHPNHIKIMKDTLKKLGKTVDEKSLKYNISVGTQDFEFLKPAIKHYDSQGIKNLTSKIPDLNLKEIPSNLSQLSSDLYQLLLSQSFANDKKALTEKRSYDFLPGGNLFQIFAKLYSQKISSNREVSKVYANEKGEEDLEKVLQCFKDQKIIQSFKIDKSGMSSFCWSYTILV